MTRKEIDEAITMVLLLLSFVAWLFICVLSISLAIYVGRFIIGVGS